MCHQVLMKKNHVKIQIAGTCFHSLQEVIVHSSLFANFANSARLKKGIIN